MTSKQEREVFEMGTGSNQQFDIGHWVLRLIALIIDSIILGIVAWILIIVLFVPFLFTGALYSFYLGWGNFLILPFITGILEVLYFAFFEVYMGATIGKKILGLHVQMMNGSKVTFDKALIRNISKIFPLLLLLDWLIAVATPGPDQRQKYTDRIAGTTVVQASQPFQSMSTTPSQ
jgi:uncharacterized RDD family membrane protein YckC